MRALRIQRHMLGFERIGDVFQEDQPEYDMLVFGRVHIISQRVSGSPELGFKGAVSVVFIDLGATGFSIFSWTSRHCLFRFPYDVYSPIRHWVSGEHLFWRMERFALRQADRLWLASRVAVVVQVGVLSVKNGIKTHRNRQ